MDEDDLKYPLKLNMPDTYESIHTQNSGESSACMNKGDYSLIWKQNIELGVIPDNNRQKDMHGVKYLEIPSCLRGFGTPVENIKSLADFIELE